MRFITYSENGLSRVGAVVEDLVVDLGEMYDSMLSLIESGNPKEIRSLVDQSSPVARVGEVTLQAPIPQPRRNVFCVGWNYLPHFEEGRGGRGDGERELPDAPTFFTKATTTVAGPADELPYDHEFSEKLDYEGELAVVIGRVGRSIPAHEAPDYVFGYSVANDVTVRDVQKRHGGQWFKGKSMDGSCPMGPWIVTRDEVADPQDLPIRCHVNGVEKQSSSTRNMYFPIARIIEELSLGMTLLPGDIILTGTPEGVGVWRDPPEFLRPGDDVTVTIPGVGELNNRVGERSLTRATREESPHVT